jgi:hypothetical protein
VANEGVELALQVLHGARTRLFGEVALHRLMEPFDLPAGLGMVGTGVLRDDAEAFELGL